MTRGGRDGERGCRPAAAAVAVVGALATLAYMLPLRGYGLTLEDEGTLYSQILRVAHGELPYLDFSTGYTPAYFATNAALWSLLGTVPRMRVVLAVVHALSVAGLTVLVARGARPLLALLVPLLYVAFIPVFPGEFCAFNVPYPAWYATLGWIATAGALIVWGGRRARGLLVAAGVSAAVTLAIKPNAGLFAIAAAALVLIGARRDAGDDAAGPLAVAMWWTLWGAVLVGVAITFGARVRALEAVVYLVPVAALLAVVAGRRARSCRAGLPAEAAALLVPFVVLSAPWLGFFAWRLGTAGFVREVLLIGTGSEEIFYVAYPAFTRWGLLVVAFAAAFAVAGVLVRRGRLDARTAVAGGIVAAVAGGIAVVAIGVMPEGLVPSLVWQLESGAFALVLAAHVAGLAWLARRRDLGTDDAAVGLLVFGVFMHLQLYPRTDFMHLTIAAPLTAAFAATLLERVLRSWDTATPARRSPGTIAVALVLVGAVVLGASRGIGLLAARPWVTLPFPVAPLGVEAAHASDHRDLAAAAVALGARVGPGEPSLGFPALDLLLVLTGARNPSAHGYFFPGRPDHREEAEVLDALVAARPAALASLNARFALFDGAPSYYHLLRRWVRGSYGLAARHGRFDVLGRADHPRAPDESADAANVDAQASLVAAADPDPSRRRAAVAAVLARVAAAPEHGLEDLVAPAGLDARATVLLVRTIRDTRDARAASYLFAMLDDGRPAVRRAVLEAMASTRAELIARRYLWAGALRPDVWPGAAALRARTRRVFAAADAPDAARAFAAYVAGELDDRESVPALAAVLAAATGPPRAGSPEADAATIGAVAASLTTMSPDGLACPLTRLLARPEPELRTLVPSLLLDLADRGNTAGEVLVCLRAAVADGGANAEQAIWTAAPLGDGALGDVLRAALGTGAVGVRRAAAWALGEQRDGDDRDVLALTTAAADGDGLVRRLAAGALAKRQGAAPRAFAAGGSAD